MRASVLAAGAFLLAAGTALPAAAGLDQCGIASWYGPGFDGRRAANGEIYDQDALTAANDDPRFPMFSDANSEIRKHVIEVHARRFEPQHHDVGQMDFWHFLAPESCVQQRHEMCHCVHV